MEKFPKLSRQAKMRVLGQLSFLSTVNALKLKTGDDNMARYHNGMLMNQAGTDFDEINFQALDEQIPELKFERIDPKSVAVDREAKAYSQQHNVSYAEALTALGHTF